METVHEIILKPDLSRFCVGFRCLVSWARRARNLRFSSGVALVSHRGGRSCGFPMLNGAFVTSELELELIQTQMTQKPMLHVEVYARALRASQNRKEDSS